MVKIDSILGSSALVITIATFLYPIMPFIKVIKGKLNYENTPTLLITTGYCYCLAWYFYGLFYESNRIEYCYIVGIIIYLLLIIIYLAYETKKYLLDAILNGLIIFNGTWAAYRSLAGVLTDLPLLKKVCIGTTCGYCIYPLFSIYKVIREKNYNHIPIITAIGTILSGICWIIYGLMNDYTFFSKCQILGICVSILEIAVSIIYKKMYPIIGQVHDVSTIEIDVADNEETSNKNKDITAVKIDYDAEETEKIKEKPVVVVSKK